LLVRETIGLHPAQDDLTPPRLQRALGWDSIELDAGENGVAQLESLALRNGPPAPSVAANRIAIARTGLEGSTHHRPDIELFNLVGKSGRHPNLPRY
jgi:hypothetical protein